MESSAKLHSTSAETESKQERNKRSYYNIGIVAYPQTSGGLGVSYTYLQWAGQFGNVLMVNPRNPEIDASIDLLIVPGGPDVNPLRYLDEGTPVSFWTQRPCVIREWFDEFVLPKYVENRTPIFGICRGHQSLAVFFGGKLIQHMYHETNDEKDRRELVHPVHLFVPEMPAARRIIKVNSLHHQAVSQIPADVATIVGWYSTEKKTWTPRTASKPNRLQEIEALVYKNYPIASVQWHPEEIYDDFSKELVEELLLTCDDRTEKI